MIFYLYDKIEFAKMIERYAHMHGIKTVNAMSHHLGFQVSNFKNIYYGLNKVLKEETVFLFENKLGIPSHLFKKVESFEQKTMCTLKKGKVVIDCEAYNRYERKLIYTSYNTMFDDKEKKARNISIKNDVIYGCYPGFKYLATYRNFNLWEYTSRLGQKFKVTFPINVAPHPEWS